MHTDYKADRPARTAAELQDILKYLTDHDVSLVNSTRLLCDVCQVHLKEVAARAGIGRNHLYLMLIGERPASFSAREAFMDLIGVDPWLCGHPLTTA